MFILDALGNVRTILLTIDQVAYSSIDNAYNMITKFARAEFFTNEAVVSIMRSTYIIIGLLALFKIALLLINAMISPDKLFEKGAGLGGIVKNICIMFVLLIAVPVLFNESMKIQQVIVDNDYVNRLFGINAGSNSNIGDMFKTSAISALINPDSDIATLTTTTDASGNKIRQYVLRTKDKVGAEKATAAGEKCSSSNSSTHCEDAINDYNKAVLSNDQTARNHMFSTLINHVGDYIKTDSGQIYVYNYSMLITFIVGIGITYLLILFSFDLAERAIKLAILEVVSPLFIVTYIDPKSAKSGPFSNWLKEVGGTYVGLYIRLAALTLIIVLTNLWNSRKGDIDLGFWGEIVFILSLLIFAKQFPKWLAGLVGVKDFDGGLGGLGKKIGSAALVGGMLTKAGHTAVGFAAGAKKMVSEDISNRNARRRQIRKNTGLTHGKQGREARRNYTKDYMDEPGNANKRIRGYFNGRKRLHNERKEGYREGGVNLVGSGAAGRNLGQFGAAMLSGGIVGAQASINANDIKGVIKGAGTAASQYGRSLGFSGKGVGGAVSSGLDYIKDKTSNAWGDETERYTAKQEAEKAEKAIRYRASGTNYTHGAEEGKIATGVGETKKVIEREFENASGGGKFELKTDADKLAKQFAVTTGSKNIDKVVDDEGKVLSYKFTGKDGTVITKSTDEIQATCGGIMTPEGVDNFLKSSYTVQQNAVSAYNDNMQAQANAVSSYNQAQTNAQATANDFNGVMSSNGAAIDKALIDAGFSEGIGKLGSSISESIKPLGDAIANLGREFDSASEDRKKEIKDQIDLLSQLKQSADANQTFTSSAQTSMRQLQSIVESQNELAPIVNSVDGNTEAEKLQTLSRNISDIDKKLKVYEKEKKE